MFADTQTVIWKERRAAMHQQGGRLRIVITLLTPLVFAVLLPWQLGQDFFVDRVIPTAIAMLMPVMIVAMTIPASFAGEREQHTLETLLASRLSDQAILFGKMGFAVLLGWGMGVGVLLVGALVVNTAYWNGAPGFFSARDFLTYVAVSLLTASAVAALGVLVSLKAPTVQDAAQRLMVIVLVPAIGLQVAGIFLLDRLDELIPRINGARVLAWLLAVLFGLAVAFTGLAVARFRRSRLLAG